MDAILKRLQEEKDLGRRRLLLVGFVSSALKDIDAKPVVVGGQAVEIYTMGDYTRAICDVNIFGPKTTSNGITALQ